MDSLTLKLLLLDLLSPIREVTASTIKSLTDTDWSVLLQMSRQHRLGPLLHWRLSRERQSLSIPEAFRSALATSFRQSAIRSLLIQRELLYVHRTLYDEGIPHVALKGAFLAFHAYEHPALRPLRDLDILLPPKNALTVYQLLIDHGFKRIDHHYGNAEAAMQVHRHLPPLRGPSGLLELEVHTHLFHRDNEAKLQQELSEDPQFWSRCIRHDIAGTPIPFESPADLLLHMIVHAVYDHQFTNGPLLLSDLAYLIDRHRINWPLFWELAERTDRQRGCILALSLMEYYWGKRPIEWPQGLLAALPTMPIKEAAVLMLRDVEAKSAVKFETQVTNHASLFGKFRYFFSTIFPSKELIAATYPVDAKSAAVYVWYPARWWWLATERLPGYLKSKRQPHLQLEVQHIRALENWLST